MTSQEFINKTINSDVPMVVGKFLVPEFNNEIGFTIDDLKQLDSLFNKLDDKHESEKYF